MKGVKNCEAITETIKKIKITEVNEIDVTKVWRYSYPVSSPKATLLTTVVTYFHFSPKYNF